MRVCVAGSTLGGQEQTIAIACYTAGVYLGGNGSHIRWAGGGGVGTHNTRALTGREWGDGGGKEGELSCSPSRDTNLMVLIVSS